MQSIRQLYRPKSRHAPWLALAIYWMSHAGANDTAFAGSNSKSFAVTANVTRRCSVAVDLPNSKNLIHGENKSAVAARLDQAVTIACSRGAMQNVRIGAGDNSAAKMIPLAESVKQILLLQDALIVTIDF
jgi:spore coat protein U-like protein